MVIRVYWASVTGNRKIVADQNRLRDVIEGLKIPSEWVDITTSSQVKEKMRQECNNPTAMPPQVFNNDRYLGDVSSMEEFVEEGRVREWFGVTDAIDSSVENGLRSTNNATEANQKSHSSPTSSIENEAPGSPSTTPLPPPTRKHVLAAAGAFESLGKEEPIKQSKSRVVFTKSRSLSSNQCENTKGTDSERRLRILGLATTS